MGFSEQDASALISRLFPGAQITSGQRSAEHNAEIGGAPDSLHVSGQAADFVLRNSGVDPPIVRRAIINAGAPVTELMYERAGDPHSTGPHFHWGWGQVKHMPQAQDVMASMNGGANIGSLGGALSSLQGINKAQQSDPQIAQAQKQLADTTQRALDKSGEIEHKLEGMDISKEIQPWDADKQAQKYSTDPIKAFGSAGSVFAILASAFTHRPMVNALNGAASAMNAIHQGDSEAYQRAYEAWKQNSDETIRRHELQMEEYKTVLDAYSKAPSIAEAELKALTAKYDDQKMAVLQSAGLLKDMNELQLKREEIGVRLKEANAKAVPFEIFNKSIDEFKKENHRAPNAQEMGNMWGQAQFSGMGMSGDAANSAGAQAAAGMPLNQVVPGYGKDASVRREQVRESAVKQIMAENPGMSAADAGLELANRTVQFQAGKKSVGQLYTMLGATRQAVSQLDFNIQKTKEEMKKLPSSDISPIINAIARGEQRWTGNPAFSSLFYYMSATAMESARILQGGQASVAQLHAGAAEEAKQWASVNMTPASFDSVATAMRQEGENRIRTFEDAMKAQQFGVGSSVGQIQPGTVQDGYRFNGGDPSDQNNWTKLQ